MVYISHQVFMCGLQGFSLVEFNLQSQQQNRHAGLDPASYSGFDGLDTLIFTSMTETGNRHNV